MISPLQPGQAPIIGLMLAGSAFCGAVLFLSKHHYEPSHVSPSPTVTVTVSAPPPSTWAEPLPQVINCGPGDDPALLIMKNQTCMSPDPEEEAIARLLEQLAKQQRELGRRTRSYPPAFPSPVPGPVLSPPSGGTLCSDGTWSRSTGRGTCSWHGGEAG